MLSIILPVHREPFLDKTIDSLLSSCVTDIEILVVVNGQGDKKLETRKDPRIKIVTVEKAGMRGAINAGIKESKGEYIMKCDAHCAFDKGFDKILIDSCKENWLIIPRRYSLDEITWDRNERRPIKDYHYLTFPHSTTKNYGKSILNADWCSREKRTNKTEIDDTMIFQGSCWLANKKYFMKHVGFLDDSTDTYGTFNQEYLEIGMKYWLGGGAIKVNKKTWYAHLSKRGRHYKEKIFSRKYKKDRQSLKSYDWAAKHWIDNEEPNMIHPFSWLIEKFSPPTWDDDWQEKWNKMK